MLAKARAWYLGAALLAPILLACGGTSEEDPPEDIPRVTLPVVEPTTAAPEPTGPAYTDANFFVGGAGGDPLQRVTCSNIDYPVAIKDASKPLHWRTEVSSHAPQVTTNPPEGDLDPGQEVIVQIKGSYDAPAGATFTVTVLSEHATSVTYTVELTCR